MSALARTFSVFATLMVGLVLFGIRTTVARADVVIWDMTGGGNGHGYEVVIAPPSITWSEARAAAIARGGDLVTITSVPEYDFIASVLAQSPAAWTGNGGIGPWVGLWQNRNSPVYTEPLGGWEWVDGSPFDPNAVPGLLGAENGSNAEDWAHCVVGIAPTYRTPFRLDDKTQTAAGAGDVILSYVVEYATPPTAVPLPSAGLAGVALLAVLGVVKRIRARVH